MTVNLLQGELNNYINKQPNVSEPSHVNQQTNHTIHKSVITIM